MVLSYGEAEEGKAGTCDSAGVVRLQEKQETMLFQSQERDACILRMTKWPIILKAISRQRKMIGTYPLDLATRGLLVAIAREDLVQWLGQRPGWRDLNSLMESDKVEGEFVDISFEKFG